MNAAVKKLSLTGLVVGGLILPQVAAAGPNCTCRHAGGEIAEGQTACIKSPSGMTMARCERVLNNTSWKMLEMPCPYSSIPAPTKSNISLAQIPLSTIVEQSTKD